MSTLTESLLGWALGRGQAPRASAQAVPPRQDRRASDRPVTVKRVRQWYERPRAFTNFLPWVDFLDEDQTVLLEDGRSVGAVLDLTPAACEARPPEHLAALHGIVMGALAHAVPETDPPWVLQFYVKPEPVRDAFMGALEAYARARAGANAFTDRYLALMDRHVTRLEKPGGYYFDDLTGAPWRARRLRERLVVFRRVPAGERSPDSTPTQALNVVVERLTQSLRSAGVRCERADARAFHAWLMRWFNPRPPIPSHDTDALLRAMPTPDGNRLFAPPDFAETLILGWPRNETRTGTWWFDGQPQTYVTAETLLCAPKIGHFSAEHQTTGHTVSFFDRMPDGCALALTVVCEAQDRIEARIHRIAKSALGGDKDAAATREQALAAQHHLADSNKLYSVNLGFFVSGTDLDNLRRREEALNGLLLSEKIMPVGRESDPVRNDAFLRALPMNYDAALDAKARWSKLQYVDACAALAPVLGRSRGTGNPGVCMWNRGGEPLVWDPLNKNDRKKNAHCFIGGMTGAGKSSWLSTVLRSQLAVNRPRLFIFDPVGSFDLVATDFERHAVSVHRVALQPGQATPLPPFTATPPTEAVPLDDTTALNGDDSDTDAASASTTRDILGEQELAARLMVTGGELKEREALRRHDQRLLQRAILDAHRAAKVQGRRGALTRDVARALKALDDVSLARAERAAEMADALELYTEGFAAEVFDRPGVEWPDADVTLLNAGTFAGEGYEDKLALAVIGFINHVNQVAETTRNDERHNILVLDEAHIVTKHPMLAPYIVKASKVWGRRFAVWMWLATQNMQDMPDHASRILNMLEWWVILHLPPNEIEQLARFRQLAPEERAMLLATRKEPGRYVEGVVFSDTMRALFRSVPPRLDLALAMTERDERAALARIMQEKACTLLEAADEMAARLERSADAFLDAEAAR